MSCNASMSENGRVGTMQAKDRRLEYMHAQCTDYNVDPKHSVEDVLFFTQYFEALSHIDNKFNQMLGLEK